MDNHPSWALATCTRIMRPLIRLALAMGVKHRALDELLRSLLLEEARRSWSAQGVVANISQLSITTGLSRKAVTARVRAPADALPQTEMSASAKTLTLWLKLADDDVALRRLPLQAGEGVTSFETLAREASRGNVHHKVILQELLRLNIAIDAEDGTVELRADGFVPAQDRETMLAFLSDNVRDHLQAGVSNTLELNLPMLERAIYAKGLSIEDCERIHQLVRARWQALQMELTGELTRAVDAAEGAGKGRIRIGVFTYLESTDEAGEAARPDAPHQD